jgi:hypothetical protein
MMKKSDIWKVLARAIGLMLLLLLLFQSTTVTVAWWRQSPAEREPWSLVWVGLLPVCVLVYIRYFSIFRRDCAVCADRVSVNSQD